MPAAPASQFSLRLTAVGGDLGGPEAVEALALDLRTELADVGVQRVDSVKVGDAPEGARGLEFLGVCAFIITVVQTGEALGKVVAAVRRVVARRAQSRQPVRVTIGGIDVDLAGAGEPAVRQIVQALLTLPAQPAAGVRDALVIANASYDDPGLAQLRSPGHDADALVRVLGDPGIGGFDVDLLLDADERTIRRRVAAFFADRDRDDLLLLHFSCHGIKDPRGRLHLAARDTDLSVLGATSVPASFVHDVLAETQSRRVVLILDCCYSGAFARGSSVRSGNDVQIADEFGSGSGRIVLTASSATEYAFEGADLTHADAQPSVFTSALVNGLETGAADLDADGEISIDELYDFTYRRVRDATPGQAPMKWSFGVEGSLVVARSVRPAALPRTIVDDLASDRVVLRLEAVRALAQLLRGGKPGLRTAALATLTELADSDDSGQVRRAATDALAGGGAANVPTTDRPGPSRPADPPAVPPRAEPARPRTEPTTPAGGADVAKPTREALPAGQPPGLFIAASLLVPVSVLLYAVGVYGVANEAFAVDWYHNLIWVAQLFAAGMLLATRRARWGGLLFGVLAWAWVDLALVLHSNVQIYFQDAWGFLVTADVIAIAAQVCLAVAAVQKRVARTNSTRVVAAALLAALAATAAFPLPPLLYEAWAVDHTEGTALRIGAAIICTAVIPAAVIAPLPDRAALLVPVGWWLGGAELALTISINLSRNGISDGRLEKVTWLWILLILTASVATAATLLLLRRGTWRRTPAR